MKYLSLLLVLVGCGGEINNPKCDNIVPLLAKYEADCKAPEKAGKDRIAYCSDLISEMVSCHE